MPPRSAIDAALRAAIRYRGRDAEGEWSDGRHARLFHSRLSIIDLAGGDQPMHDHSGRYTIVFNGEIYNFLELKNAYVRAGARFLTASDTEVILEGYKLKGSAVCRELNGMFAFAIWDSRDRALFLARDRLGKKPLFWTMLGNHFYFSSTLDAFAGVPGWTGRLSPAAIALFGRLGVFPDSLTVYPQAQALPPASHATVAASLAPPQIRKYWRLKFPTRRLRDFAGAADEYEALLIDAIRLRLRADVPLAITFSGGVDSGTIAALATRRLGVQLKCYTIDYDAEGDRSEETAIARKTAALLGLDWNYLHYDYRNTLLEDLIDAYRAFDQPCSNAPMAYSQRLYNLIRPYATVVLSGAGSDEIFTGYVGNEQLLLRDRIERWSWLVPDSLRRALPTPLRRVIAKRAPGSEDFARMQCDYLRGGFRDDDFDEAAGLAVESIFQDIVEAGVSSHLDLLQFMSLRYFGAAANFLLPDVTGLRAQIEVRSPYLDYRMVEFAATLPGEFKVRSPGEANGVKFLPKTVYARYVPPEIAWASKKGMAMNIKLGPTFAADVNFAKRAQAAIARIEASGLDAREFRNAWANFTGDFRAGKTGSRWAGVAMAGFMLGQWLDRTPIAVGAPA